MLCPLFNSDLFKIEIVAQKNWIEVEPIIKNLKLTESEQLAAIAHEIGHILFFFLENKEDYPVPNGEEIYCDSIACKIGLSAEMLSIIIKLINDKNYSEFSCSLYIRKNILKHYR